MKWHLVFILALAAGCGTKDPESPTYLSRDEMLDPET